MMGIPSAQIASELLGSEPMAPQCPHVRSSNHQSETLHETRGSPVARAARQCPVAWWDSRV